MRIIFTSKSWEDLNYWQQNDLKIIKKINELIIDISRNPFSGVGKPEALKHQFKGFWSIRITSEHRLVYKVQGEDIIILKCRFHYD